MRKKLFPSGKDFWLWACLTGLLFVVVALAPQIDLLAERGVDWNGVYAMSEFFAIFSLFVCSLSKCTAFVCRDTGCTYQRRPCCRSGKHYRKIILDRVNLRPQP
jgi:hypothetical protein